MTWHLVADPRDYRLELPRGLFRRFEDGELSRAQFWRELMRLWGEANVDRLLAREAERCAA